MSPRPLTLVVALALMATTCSSGDDGSTATTAAPARPTVESTPRSTTTETTTATTTEATTATTLEATTTTDATTTSTTEAAIVDAVLTDAQLADRELATSALITIDLFPDDWIEEPADDEADDAEFEAEFEAEFNACLDRTDEERVGDDLEPLRVSTGDFVPVEEPATSVAHEVGLAPDETTAITAMAEVRIDGAESCLADVVERFYTATFADDPELADIVIGDVIVTRPELTDPPDLAVGVVVEIPLTIGDETLSQFLEILYQRQGRALSKLSFSSLGRRFDESGYTLLGDEVSARLADIGS